MIHATAGAKVYIGSASSSISLVTEFEAETWTEIKEVEDLGEWGAEATELTIKSVAENHVRRRKGMIDNGTMTLVVARDPADDGQNMVRAAMDDFLPYAFKVELADKPTTDGTNTIFYFRAPVMSARNSFGTGDNIAKTTFALGIDGVILEVPAAEAVV